MFNEFAVVTVGKFSKQGAEADKNGVSNVYLTPVAGKVPNKAMVVAGTVAATAGLNIGETLLIMITERKPDAQYGRQFSHTVLGKAETKDLIGYRRDLGTALVIDATDSTEDGEGNEILGKEKGATPGLNTSKVPGAVEKTQEELDAEAEALKKAGNQQGANANKQNAAAGK